MEQEMYHFLKVFRQANLLIGMISETDAAYIEQV